MRQASSRPIQLTGAEVGTEYDQLQIRSRAQSVSLSDLEVTLGFDPLPGKQFVIVDNQSSEEFLDIFSGMPEGASLLLNGHELLISYIGGDGNDIVLTAPGPAVAGQKFDDLNSNGVHDSQFSRSLPNIQREFAGPIVLPRGDDSSSVALPLGFRLHVDLECIPPQTRSTVAKRSHPRHVRPFQHKRCTARSTRRVDESGKSFFSCGK